MVLRHFHLREQPFGVTPDTRFLFASATHREALAALVYGMESGLGFVMLTANPGMGKTTILFEALRRINETAQTVFLFQTITSPAELMRALLIDLGLDDPRGTLVDLQTQLNQILVSQGAAGKRLVVFIDEAQNLLDEVLEAVRMLSNFETGSAKLMQIVLCGQLQLAHRLADRRLLQLRQRISIFAHLRPLTEVETAGYIQHRLKTAGWQSVGPLFTPHALALIARESRGVPRNINNICFNALSLACAMEARSIGVEVIREVLGDLDIGSISAPAGPPAAVPAFEASPKPAPVIPMHAAACGETISLAAPARNIEAATPARRLAAIETQSSPAPVAQPRLAAAAPDRRLQTGLARALAGSAEDLRAQWN